LILYGDTEKEVDLTFTNYANQTKLYGKGYRFVYKEEPENYYPDNDYEEDEEFRWKRYMRDINFTVKYLNNYLR
jgi:hypothetical protein